MRIVYDLRPLQLSSKKRGIGRYSIKLLEALSEADHDNTYYLLQYKDTEMPKIKLAGSFRYENYPIKPFFLNKKKVVSKFNIVNIISDYLTLGSQIKKINPDVIHFPSPMEHLAHYNVHDLNKISVATFHDIIPIIERESIFIGKFRHVAWAIYNMHLKTLPKMGHVIFVSQNTKKDVMKLINFPAEKGSVIYHGAPTVSEEAESKPLPPGAEKGKFVLFVGACPVYKNPDVIIEALSILKNEQDVDLKFVIAGESHSRNTARLNEKAEKSGISSGLIFAGYVDDGTLSALYKNCVCSVLPSHYEGFGLPVLEAMVHGSPVIASNVSSIPEIAGNAAVLLPPNDARAWADEILKIYKGPVWRNELIEKGRKQAACFSWRETAGKTIDVYRKVARRKN